MTHISKHHAEEEWKCDTRVNCWVHFFVRRHAVSVDDLLVYLSEFVGLDKGRWNEFFIWDLFQIQFVVSCIVLWQINYAFRHRSVEFFQEQGLRKMRPHISIGNGSVSSQFVQLGINGFL